jgi:redox-sensing transcriptional repressor
MSRAEPSRQQPATTTGTEPRLSRASVGRFSLYLRRLERFRDEGERTVSSGQLGEALGIPDTQVRKDLAYLGNLGHRGVGYRTDELIAALRAALGVDRPWSVVLVGVGNLARALLRYRGFQRQGFHIVALFDADPAKVGQKVDGLTVHAPEAMAEVIAATGAELAILTVPSEVAQDVADRLVAAGVRGLMNFAPAVLRLPPHVRLVPVDLAVQLEQLAFLVHLGGAQDDAKAF